MNYKKLTLYLSITQVHEKTANVAKRLKFTLKRRGKQQDGEEEDDANKIELKEKEQDEVQKENIEVAHEPEDKQEAKVDKGKKKVKDQPIHKKPKRELKISDTGKSPYHPRAINPTTTHTTEQRRLINYIKSYPGRRT